ncbi:MAG: opacity family porin [Pasteurella oralis]|uniref:opacity family porin n=1 Tax=Pasteurella oralis TaxID=1071947 RepID=UPI002711C034|nr:opacity family porin [Pasteurella oralis]
MKKSLLVLALGTLFAATASANFYVQGDLGSTKIKAKGGEDGKFSKNVFEPRLSVGYKFSDFRLALDYSHYNKIKETFVDADEVTKTDFKIRGLGLSAIYDFTLNAPVTPFVGARLSLNHFSTKDYTVYTSGSKETEKANETRVGFGVLAGADYKLTPNLALVGTVEYNRLGRSEDVKIDAYGAKVGLRYDF